MRLLRIAGFAAVAGRTSAAAASPFGDAERSSLSNVGGVLEGMQGAMGDLHPDEQRMVLVGVGAAVLLLFLLFTGLRSSR